MSSLVGLAAEHLVIADLAHQGVTAFITPGHLSYDLVADTGSRLVRVQVKAASKFLAATNRNKARWRFKLVDGRGNRYQEDAFELYALAVPKLGLVAYITKASVTKHTFYFDPETLVETFNQLTLEKALAAL